MFANSIRHLQETVFAFSLKAGGLSDPKLIAECSPTELGVTAKRGFLNLGYTTFNAVAYSAVATYLAGEVNGYIILIAWLFALLQGFTDHYIFNASTHQSDGIQNLLDAGVDLKRLSPDPAPRRYAVISRIFVGVTLSAVTALVIGLSLNASALNERIEREFLANNKLLVERASTEFDQMRERKKKQYDDQSARVTAMGAERVTEMRAASRQARAAKQDGFLAAETAKKAVDARIANGTQQLTKFGDDLNRHVADRSEFIRRAIEKSPDHIPRNSGLVRKLHHYADEVRSEPWAAIPTMLAEIAFVAIDLTVLSVKGLSPYSSYSTSVARSALERVLAQAKIMIQTVGTASQPPKPPPAPPAPAPTPPDDKPPLSPLRRGRGRPRKHPLTNGHDPMPGSTATLLPADQTEQSAQRKENGK